MNRTEPSPDSVSTLLSTVQHLFDDELQRGRELDTKDVDAAGFSGTILALTATISKDLLPVHVGSFTEVAIRTLFVLAIVSLAFGAVSAVAGALLPHPRFQIDSSVIREFASFPLIAAEKIEIPGAPVVAVLLVLGGEAPIVGGARDADVPPPPPLASTPPIEPAITRATSIDANTGLVKNALNGDFGGSGACSSGAGVVGEMPFRPHIATSVPADYA